MAAGLTTNVNAAFAYASTPIGLIDEKTMVIQTGSGIAFVPTSASSNLSFIWPKYSSQGVSAFAVNVRTKCVALAARGKRPAIEVYQWPSATLVGELTGGTDLEYTAIAFARNATRIAGFGGSTDYSVTVWSLDRREKLEGATAVLPSPCSHASFNPLNASQMCSGGEGGIYFWHINETYESWKLKCVRGKLPSDVDGPLEDDLGVGDSDEDEEGLVGDGHGTDAGDVDRAPPPPPMAGSAHHKWTCHCWSEHGQVYAANYAGEVARFDPVTGEAVAVNSEAAGGVRVTSLVMSREHLVAGCEDGVLRYLRMPSLELDKSVTLAARASDGSAPILPIAHASPSPSYEKLYVGTKAGTLHVVALDHEDGGESKVPGVEDPDRVDPYAAVSLSDLHTGPVLCATAVPGVSPGDTVFASIGADQTLRLWDYAKRRLLCRRSFMTTVADATTDAAAESDDESEESHSDDGSEHQRGDRSARRAAVLTSVACHPSLPLLAVGTGEGRLMGVLVEAATTKDASGMPPSPTSMGLGGGMGSVGSAKSLAATMVHSDWLHDGPTTCVSFCPDPAQPLLITMSATDRKLFVVDGRVANTSGPSAGGQTAAFRVIAFATLPAGPDRRPISVSWNTNGGLGVVVSLESGELVSMPLPAPPATAGGCATPADVSSTLRIRHRLQFPASIIVGKDGTAVALSPMSKNLNMVGVDWEGSSTDGGSPVDPEALSPPIGSTAPASTVAAHYRGILTGCFAPGGTKDVTLLATGGLDGSVGICVLRGRNVVASALLEIHSGPVLHVSFSKDSRFVLSTGMDGAIYSIALSGDLVSSGLESLGRTAPDKSLLGAYRLVATSVKPVTLRGSAVPMPASLGDGIIEEEDEEDDEGVGAGGGGGGGARGRALKRQGSMSGSAAGSGEATVEVPGSTHAHLLARIAAEEETRKEEASMKVKEAFMEDVRGLEVRLRALLAANDTCSDLERLGRREFVVDEKGRDTIVDEFAHKAAGTRSRINMENAKRDVIMARIRAQCWDSMEVPSSTVRSFESGAKVHKFAIRRRSGAEMMRQERVVNLRRVELLELSVSRDADTTATPPVWAGLTEDCPSDAEWIVNAGLLPPSVDPTVVQARKRGPGEGKDDGEEKGEGDDEGEGDGDMEAEGEEAPSDDEDDGGDEWDGARLAQLLYHPLAVRTPNQRRTQLQLMNALCRAVRQHFNVKFDDLAKKKSEAMEIIAGKNARIHEILDELNPDDVPEVVDPSLADDEVPSRVLEVSQEEIGFEKYVSEAELRRRQEDEERKRREAGEGKDDAPERALQDMMGGTLEARDQLKLLEQELVREPWMDELTEEEMSEEQLRALELFEEKQRKVSEEKAKHRKSLELELRKLQQDVRDVMRQFDDAVAAVNTHQLAFSAAIHAQEMYMLRLASSLQNREHGALRDRRLEGKLSRLIDLEVKATEAHSMFQRQVMNTTNIRDELVAEDKTQDRTFRERIKETAGPVEPDVMRALTALYRRRATGGVDSSYAHSSMRDASRVHGSSVTSAKGKGSYAGGGGGKNASFVDAMKQAMSDALREAGETSALDPFRAGDRVQASDNVDEEAERREALQPLTRADCPDGFDPDDSPEIWGLLNSLRTKKIEVELDVKSETRKLTKMQSHLEVLTSRLDAIRNAITDVENNREELLTAREISGNNLELLVRMNQGQDEMEAGPEAIVTDYAGAALIPRSIVEANNSVIRRLGTEKVAILEKIRDFRKSINLMEWEHRYLKLKAGDVEEHYTDLHMLRVTKGLQEFIKGGDITEKQKRDAEKAEAKVQHMRASNDRAVNKVKRQLQKLEDTVKGKEEENEKYERQRRELEAAVSVRESIFRSRVQNKGGSSDPAAQSAARMKAITTRRKLVDLARAQTDEIDFLRQELDRLRQRTFPSFAHSARVVRGNVDES